MIRNTGKLFQIFSNFNKNVLKREMCVLQHEERQTGNKIRETETCRVSLTGKVVLRPTISEKGTAFVTFENVTQHPNKDRSYRVWHTAMLFTEAQKKLAESIELNNQVYFEGFIRAQEKQFEGEEKKLTDGSLLVPSRFFVSPAVENRTSDLNHVALFGKVRRVNDTENVTYLTVSTPTFIRERQRIESLFHSISVDNPILREAAKELQEGDLVHVAGRLINRSRTLSDRKLKSPLILGTDLIKVN